jgi:hypothetical protein
MTDLVDALTRWEASGGHWRVLADADAQITLGLYTCDGGEEMERVTGEPDPAVRAFLAGRTRSDD